MAASAETALADDAFALLAFVEWKKTPQGQAFWEREYRRVANGGRLSEQARLGIDPMLVADRQMLAAPPPPSFDRSAAALALTGDARRSTPLRSGTRRLKP